MGGGENEVLAESSGFIFCHFSVKFWCLVLVGLADCCL